MIVVDASLAVKWMLWEDRSDEALTFLFANGRNLCALDILFVEVAGAIVRRANENKAIAEDARVALDKWTVAWGDHAVTPHRVTQVRLRRAANLAIDLGHPLKDCLYLVLAMELNCDLATCDAKFAAKAKALYPDVRLLSDYDVTDGK